MASQDLGSPQEIMDAFGTTVDFVGNNRVVFDVSGNKYRVIVAFAYACKRGLIKFVGTHAQHDRIDAEKVQKMDIRPIRTEEDYDWALAEIAHHFDDVPEKGTPEADRFDVLTVLSSAYEARKHPIEPLGPIDFILAHMEEAGLRQRDFAEVVGSASRASEFLNRKRPLTLGAVQGIHRHWRLPASVFIQTYHLDEDTALHQAAARPRKRSQRGGR